MNMASNPMTFVMLGAALPSLYIPALIFMRKELASVQMRPACILSLMTCPAKADLLQAQSPDHANSTAPESSDPTFLHPIHAPQMLFFSASTFADDPQCASRPDSIEMKATVATQIYAAAPRKECQQPHPRVVKTEFRAEEWTAATPTTPSRVEPCRSKPSFDPASVGNARCRSLTRARTGSHGCDVLKCGPGMTRSFGAFFHYPTWVSRPGSSSTRTIPHRPINAE